MDKNSKNNRNFIEFLLNEFNITAGIKMQNKKETNIVAKRHDLPTKFNWFFLSDTKSLDKVLEVKLNVDNAEVTGKILSSNLVDLEDEQADEWQKNYNLHQKNLLKVLQSKPVGIKQAFISIFTQSFFNIPGVLSFCREEKKEELPRSLANKYTSLVLATFIGAIMLVSLMPNMAYKLIGASDNVFVNGWHNPKTISPLTKNQPPKQSVKQVNENILAEYIKANSDKFTNNQRSKDGTFLITEADLFGQTADAMEIPVSDTQENNKISPKFKSTLDRAFTGTKTSLYIILKNLEDRQKNASLYLGNAVSSLVSR
jgi:hypothetical protein